MSEAKFKPGDRVVTLRHGPGRVVSSEWIAGYGYCYRVALDDGMSTGGMQVEGELSPEHRHCWHPFGVTFPAYGGSGLSFCCGSACKHVRLGRDGEEKTHGGPVLANPPKVVIDEATAENFVAVRP